MAYVERPELVERCQAPRANDLQLGVMSGHQGCDHIPI